MDALSNWTFRLARPNEEIQLIHVKNHALFIAGPQKAII